MDPYRSWQSLLPRMTRRDVLHVGFGGGLSFLLPALSGRAAERRGPERPISLITLWMAGGPSQLETWDPHPESKLAGSAGAIPTTLPDVRIAEFFPRMAEQMHHVSVVRSLVSKEGDHERGTYYVQTGYRPDPSVVHPSITALIAKMLPVEHLEIPAHVALGSGEGFVIPRGGYLGAQFDAFRIADPGRTVENLQSRVDDRRQQRRLEGLDVVARSFRAPRPVQAETTLHEHVVDKALAMMSSEQLRALTIDDEPEAVKSRYGATRFGRGCLVARRLVEQGVRAVQVTLPGFDTHANNRDGHQQQAEILDPAMSALLADLAERDLLQSTIVLCIGEFGRTPWINALNGRDHWPVGFSCLIGGGGIPAGRVIGSTDPDVAVSEKDKRQSERKPPHDPIPVPDLYATILTVLGLDPGEEIHTPIGRPIRLSEGTPISGLLPSRLS